MKRSKKYLEALKKVDTKKKYSPLDAMTLLPQISLTKFAGSVDVEIIMALNEKQKKETVRGSFIFPNQFGTQTKILVFAEKADQAKAVGADIVGAEELVPEIEAGKLQFDVVLCTPAMMPKIAKLGRTLGTKGLMPNPKNGTITVNLAEAVKKFKAGMRQFKMKEVGRINGVIGKTDMAPEKLVENYQAFVGAVNNELKKFGANPTKSIAVAPTMGPSLNIQIVA